jgi:hypothetical protein
VRLSAIMGISNGYNPFEVPRCYRETATWFMPPALYLAVLFASESYSGDSKRVHLVLAHQFLANI